MVLQHWRNETRTLLYLWSKLEKKSSQKGCTLSGPCELEYRAQLQNFGLWLYQLWLTVSSASASLGSSGSESGAVPGTVLASEASSASATDAASCSQTHQSQHMSHQNMPHMKCSHFCAKKLMKWTRTWHSDDQHHGQKMCLLTLIKLLKCL